MNYLTSFPERLRTLRQRKGLTVEELARIIGVSRPTIWGWESARHRPRNKMLSLIAGALDVSVQEILGTSTTHSLERQEQFSEQSSPTENLPNEARVITRAREEIARYFGVEPKNVRISVEI